ncbi:hypothetical protein TSUD_291200 [Trifolium subterraneum]|uniref:Uncharacterized protein n=1 Tax=Trifolium subterraneum TaxID=3900 RepID=A0A2Z6NNR5_TRISU|nr:hypothetical protein TSUD_291200 [Trifolium subterraneum]
MDYAAGGNFYRGYVMPAGLEKMSFMKGSHPYDNMSKRMDHERAYFDYADWAFGKPGAQKPKGPLEALRPKLQVVL